MTSPSLFWFVAILVANTNLASGSALQETLAQNSTQNGNVTECLQSDDPEISLECCSTNVCLWLGTDWFVSCNEKFHCNFNPAGYVSGAIGSLGIIGLIILVVWRFRWLLRCEPEHHIEFRFGNISFLNCFNGNSEEDGPYHPIADPVQHEPVQVQPNPKTIPEVSSKVNGNDDSTITIEKDVVQQSEDAARQGQSTSSTQGGALCIFKGNCDIGGASEDDSQFDRSRTTNNITNNIASGGQLINNVAKGAQVIGGGNVTVKTNFGEIKGDLNF